MPFPGDYICTSPEATRTVSALIIWTEIALENFYFIPKCFCPWKPMLAQTLFDNDRQCRQQPPKFLGTRCADMTRQ